ncbi:hypothetical protein ACIOG4_27570 [Streptomyces microflavus]|uniref:hypothetical protein n=1 Tax=Streptomyces microflavus TaxID=1919 RepID=UPI00380FDDEF
MNKPTGQLPTLAQFAPSLRLERFDEVVHYDDAATAKPPQRMYEKVWEGKCGPDLVLEDGETVRPSRLRVRWFQNGDATPRWDSTEVTGRVVLPDGGLDRRPVREIWTRYHDERGQIPEDFAEFVRINSPEPRPSRAV